MSEEKDNDVTTSPDKVTPNPGTGEPVVYMIWQNISSINQSIGQLNEKLNGLNKRFDSSDAAVEKHFGMTDEKIDKIDTSTGETKTKVDNIYLVVKVILALVALCGGAFSILKFFGG